ncbi:MAG: hypothetical protein AAF333_10670 [Planctomycetota bacterium]
MLRRSIAFIVLAAGLSLFMSSASAQFLSTEGTSNLIKGERYFTAWKSGNFDGSALRRWWSDQYGPAQVDINQYDGGYDCGIRKPSQGKTQLKNAKTGKSMYIKWAGNIWHSGWWVWGGKVTVSPGTSAWPWGSNHYETYIVEDCKKTPTQLEAFINGMYHKTEYYNGSNYKFYTKSHNNHKQLWIVRQNYRSNGWMNVGQMFRNLGGTGGITGDYYVHDIKASVEFFGRVEGWFQIRDLNLFKTW